MTKVVYILFLTTLIEIRPVSTEISRYAKQVLTDATTAGRPNVRPENILLSAYIVNGGIKTQYSRGLFRRSQ